MRTPSGIVESAKSGTAATGSATAVNIFLVSMIFALVMLANLSVFEFARQAGSFWMGLFAVVFLVASLMAGGELIDRVLNPKGRPE
jgi:hypothetical protein